MTINIFISYSWKNSSERVAIAHSLKELDDVNVFYDNKNIPKGMNIHPNISELLDRSHIVITLLTKESVASPEVRDELVRADERGLIILPIVASSVEDSEIPFFMRDINHIPYLSNEQFDTVLTAIVSAVEELRADIWKPTITKCLRKIIKHLDKFKDLPTFRKVLAQDLLQDADDEILKVTQDYRLDIGVQRNYLTRAKPIFRHANAIYAVSIASISTFWSDTRNYNLAKSYLDSQKSNVYRLFVFENAEEANSFKNILQANHMQYGTTGGGVFLCSKTTYLDFISKIFSPELLPEELYSRDFAYLRYDFNGSNYWLMALLDNAQLEFKQIDTSRVGASTDIQSFTEQFHSLANLSLGSFDNRKILRWDPDLLVEPNNHWAEKLSELFDERKGSVYHFVFFKQVSEHLENVIYNLKNEIHKLARYPDADFLINKIWLGKVIDNPATDDLGVELNIAKDYEYVLLIELPCNRDLYKYYSFSFHTDARERLYSKLDSEINYLYEEKNKLSSTKAKNKLDKRELEKINRNIKRVLTIIEKLASHHIVRMDFIDEEKNSSIAAQPAIPFGNIKY